MDPQVLVRNATCELNSRVISVPAIPAKDAIQQLQKGDFLFTVTRPWDGVKSREEFPKRNDKIEANRRVAGYLLGSLIEILATAPCVRAKFVEQEHRFFGASQLLQTGIGRLCFDQFRRRRSGDRNRA